MSKLRKQRTSASGQYVSPMLNELEWLEDEAEEPASKDEKPKSRRGKQNYRPQTQTKPNKRKSDSTGKINWSDGLASVASKRGRRSTPPAPLLLIDKPKIGSPRNSWLGDFLGFDPWTQEQAGEFADALHSFQLGLDGILKSGEELRIIPPRRRAVVIDVERENDAETPIVTNTDTRDDVISTAAFGEQRQQQQEEEAVSASSPHANQASVTPLLHQFGIVPFRFDPFDEWSDIVVTFEEPFADDGYAFVATSNEPGCRTVVFSKATNGAVVRLLRDSMAPELGGELNWIALGDR